MGVPTIAETKLSRRAKNTLKKMGMRADDPVTKIKGGYNDFLKIQSCGPVTASELSKFKAKQRMKYGSNV